MVKNVDISSEGTTSPSNNLLMHYKQRLDDFQAERKLMLERLEDCSVKQEQLHQLEWDSRKKAEDIRGLQQALSDAQALIYEERQRLLALQAENDELKLQDFQDRQKIQQLLSMAPPLEQEVTYNRGSMPSTVTSYPTNMGKHTIKENQKKEKKDLYASPERVLRTVFLPAENADCLQLKVESLHAQLQEQKQLAEERVQALLSDRKLRQEEEELHRTNLNVHIEQLTQRLKQSEDSFRTFTRDYILARKQKQEADIEVATVKAASIDSQRQLREELNALRIRMTDELQHYRSTADKKLQEYTANFREQIQAREEELLSLSSVHMTLKEHYESINNDLTTTAARLKAANEQLEQRRAMDMEGFVADVTLLRQRMTALDRKLLQMRLLERIADEDRLEKLLCHMSLRQPPVEERTVRSARCISMTSRATDDDDNEGAQSHTLEGELGTMKGKLHTLEARIREKRRRLSNAKSRHIR